MEAHNAKVQTISSRIANFHSLSQKFRISHGSTNSTRNQHLRDKSNTIDTSSLTSILSLDTKSKTILVEANVPMDRLVEATLTHKLIPPVVADFPGITVGGAYSGTTGESSSFKYGFFDRTVKRVEMVLGTGEVVSLSATERGDLFRGAAGSLGTLGVITLLEIELLPAEKFVQVTYFPVGSIAEAVEVCKKETTGEGFKRNDYVDGILFSKSRGVVIIGRLLSDPRPRDLPIVRFSGRKDAWFYMHVEKRLIASTGTPVTELVPLPDYLFRYDRGCFWTGRTLFSMTSWLPFNRTTRAVLDDFCKTRMLYAALHAQPINLQIFHDCGIPYSKAQKFLEWSAEETGIWPVWLCPLKQSPRPTLHPHTKGQRDQEEGEEEGGILNVGIWGNSRGNSIQSYLEENEALERKLKSVEGLKWLYSPQWAEEEEFYEQFDRKWYDSLRDKYGATETVPTIYEKSRTDPGDLQRKVDALTWRDYRPLIFPGMTIHFLHQAWKTGQWRGGRNSRWMDWVPRGKK